MKTITASPSPLLCPPKNEFRDAMSLLGAAVNVITTDGPLGRAGFTASAVCSVTDEPPTLLVCLNRSSSAYAAFAQTHVLCVNVLGAGQQDIANRFGGKTPMAERFEGLNWSLGHQGAPVLQEASVSFECHITQRTETGTHDVLFCQVRRIVRPDATQAGLIYFDRRYHELAA